ncbi:GntR family transcriptional regulator [Thalassococcus sp. S3]|uniref:GntR family transcriptional regulator n=1 Tax=Thalassococcus sp. S3 TaxID=2017482 RepID=UPI001023FBB1|nr:GntR family transcriptional regulator [Thalassococcus sp. S3]QBF34020.1 GntR family transcriptional regulator [Thalassococcus sp. S3]
MAVTDIAERTTSTDHIFETLYERIVSLDLLPGTKMSETDVAKSFGYSRQPVREAFTRLANLNLLLIRPQRATIVRPFSRDLIADARFLRLAIELEVVRQAALSSEQAIALKLNKSLKAQREAISAGDTKAFHELDYDFHNLLCAAAGRPAAFDQIAANKAQVDRLCMLSLTSAEAMETLYQDHADLVAAIAGNDPGGADTVLRRHLSRLDPIIDAIYTTHRGYFED